MDATRSKPPATETVFVTGGTGYIGGRLVPRLLEAGYGVRCLARSSRKLRSRTWTSQPGVEVVEGGVGDDALADAMRGCRVAYYLVHSMEAAGPDYRDRDRRLAEHFAQAADVAGVERIIYLGGLGETGDALSEHLSSRREVEAALASTPVPVTVFRAAMIIGSGSASFEILRYLVEHLPIMITPRWVKTECQPIAVRNVLGYLVDCLHAPETIGATLDIGGPDVVTYLELMRTMAEERGLPRRLVIPVPVLTPRLSSLWIHLVTPLSARMARPLAEGLRNRVVCRDDRAARLMPQRLLGVREAIDAALGKIEASHVETSWSDAGPIPGDPDWSGGTVLLDDRSTIVDAAPAAVFGVVSGIGGDRGYFAANWLWRVRGWLDRIVGGPGLRRGRRDPHQIDFGDTIDFWRVTAFEPDRRLELRAEMKVPGIARLEFEVEPDGPRSRLRQIARFKPHGLFGLLYWYAVLPAHHFVFGRMLEAIRRLAEQRVEAPHVPGTE